MLALAALDLTSSTCALLAQGTYTRTTSRYEDIGSEGREHALDIERSVIDVRIDAPNKKVRGVVTHFFRVLRERVDTIVLDGVNMKIQSSNLHGKPVRCTVADSTVTVLLDTPLLYGQRDSLRFEYECTPRKGMHFTGWNDSTQRARKQIWTQGEDNDNRHWCVLYDYPNDKMITETIISFDSSYQVLSNGNLVSTRINSDGTKTWHYAMTQPHVSYLIMIAIGKYAVEHRMTKRGIPLHLYYYPEYPQRVQPTYRYSAEMIDFMEELLDTPFPWESYAQVPVQDFIFGAMENTTATVFGDFSLCDARGVLDRSYLNTNVHELTHQWFGDFITERNWKNIWLHESFATFYPKLFSRRFLSEDVYQWMRRGEQNSALGTGTQDRLPIVHDASGTTRRYPKGSAVLDMLRHVIGEANFDHAVSHYLKRHAYANVHTDEFYLAFQDALGMSLDWFFDEWIYRGNEPSYTVSYKDLRDEHTRERVTTFLVEQMQMVDALSPLFTMPIDFEVHYTDGTRSARRETISRQAQLVSIPNPQNKTIAFTLFDPGSYVLKRVDFKKSFEELKQQAEHAPNMIDRYDAVKFLHEDSTFSEEETELFLTRMFEREKFHAIKGEIVARMAKSRSSAAQALLRTAINDSDVEVRKAVLNNTRKISPELRGSYEALLRDSSYWIIESAFNKLCESFPERAAAYAKQLDGVRSPAERVHIAVLERRALQAEQRAFDTLVDYTTSAFEFHTRQNAFSALKRLNHCDIRLVHSTIDALFSTNNRLADHVRGVCEYWIQQSEYKKLFADYYRSNTWERWEREILSKVLGERMERRRR